MIGIIKVEITVLVFFHIGGLGSLSGGDRGHWDCAGGDHGIGFIDDVSGIDSLSG